VLVVEGRRGELGFSKDRLERISFRLDVSGDPGPEGPEARLRGYEALHGPPCGTSRGLTRRWRDATTSAEVTVARGMPEGEWTVSQALRPVREGR
jgi:hypothetical protein